MEDKFSSFFKSCAIFCTIYTATATYVQAEIYELSLEDLMQMEVTSVSKSSQTLASAAAAIYVLTGEDIRSSGVTSIPEALRMVPGMQVARIDANKWAISSRGFNSRFANKMLVLVDGRSVYTHSFAGVYWELQHTALDNIDRIEVIRGPGASLWGSNAVNGVVNIITKDSGDTKGGLLDIGMGSQDNSVTFRYGSDIGDQWNYRVYGNHRSQDDSASAEGGDARDGWFMNQLGFRMDGVLNENNRLTVQGDFYEQEADQLYFGDPTTYFTLPYIDQEIDQSGGNILTRWTRAASSGGELIFQAYIDRAERREVFQDELRTSFDVDMQYHFAQFGDHNLIVGGGYRLIDHRTTPTSSVVFYPDDENYKLANSFIQDDISFLEGDLHLVLGIKAEKNDYTDVEIQPSVRLSWSINPHNTLWAAVSRSVRLPTRIEVEGGVQELFPPNRLSPFPIVIQIVGNPQLTAEKILAFELGFRSELSEKTTLDLAFYHNDYEDLIAGDIIATYCSPSVFCDDPETVLIISTEFSTNKTKGSNDIGGYEIVLNQIVHERVSLKLGYSHTRTNLAADRSTAILDPGVLSRNAEHQATLQSHFQLGDDLKLVLESKYVDQLENVDLESYYSVNMAIHWRLGPGINLSLVGQNLTNREHMEFKPEALRTEETEVKRSYYANLTWKF